jgi:hypothetical protein
MNINLNELEAAVGRMTPGPWAIANWGYTDEPHMVIEGPEKQKPPTHGDRFWFGGQKAVDWGDDWDAVNAAGIVALRNAAPELIKAARERDELRAESAKHRTALKSLESLHEQAMIVASASNTQKAQEIAALKDQRDELAGLVKELRGWVPHHEGGDNPHLHVRIDAALAKVGP